MTRRMSCSWCHEMNTILAAAPTFCEKCEHRGDLARMDCDCAVCRRTDSPRDEVGKSLAVGDAVKFVEPYQGFTGGTVAELLRGVAGPIAGVRLPGTDRTADTLCRRLRKV